MSIYFFLFGFILTLVSAIIGCSEGAAPSSAGGGSDSMSSLGQGALQFSYSSTSPIISSSIKQNKGFRVKFLTSLWQTGVLSPAGDFNNDGFDDFIIGVSKSNSSSGQAVLILGRDSNQLLGVSEISAETLNGNNGGVLLSEGTAGVEFGSSVANLGDINGDGRSDICIGAPYKNGAAPFSKGEAYILFGQVESQFSLLSGLANLISQINPLSSTFPFSAGWKVSGDNFANLGFSINSAGDFNGDGYNDIVIGTSADTNETATGAAQGRTFILYGKQTFSNIPVLDKDVSPQIGFNVDGGLNNEVSGVSVQSAGDIDGDGFDDLLIGAAGSKRVYILFGRNSSIPDNLSLPSLNGVNGGAILESAQNGNFGKTVRSVGDVNRDGLSDFVVVNTTDSTKGYESGVAYIIFGRFGASGRLQLHNLDVDQLDGTNGGFKVFGNPGNPGASGFGAAFGDLTATGAGDFNGDGFDDIIIGSPKTSAYTGSVLNTAIDRNSGEVYVIMGHSGSVIKFV